jgi:hypothetical protein
VLRAIEVFTIVASEREIDFEPAFLAFQMPGPGFGIMTCFLLLMLVVYTSKLTHMAKCDVCRKDVSKPEKCQFCGKLFCGEDYLQHMSWERRHAGLAEEEGTFWRKKRESPS